LSVYISASAFRRLSGVSAHGGGAPQASAGTQASASNRPSPRQVVAHSEIPPHLCIIASSLPRIPRRHSRGSASHGKQRLEAGGFTIGPMSRAFIKETDQDADALPERAISAHANFVTARGLALLDQSIHALEAERTAARAGGQGVRAHGGV